MFSLEESVITASPSSPTLEVQFLVRSSQELQQRVRLMRLARLDPDVKSFQRFQLWRGCCGQAVALAAHCRSMWIFATNEAFLCDHPNRERNSSENSFRFALVAKEQPAHSSPSE